MRDHDCRLLLHFGEKVGHGRAQRRGELLHDEDRRHALASFQESDVVAMQVGLAAWASCERPATALAESPQLDRFPPWLLHNGGE